MFFGCVVNLQFNVSVPVCVSIYPLVVSGKSLISHYMSDKWLQCLFLTIYAMVRTVP